MTLFNLNTQTFSLISALRHDIRPLYRICKFGINCSDPISCNHRAVRQCPPMASYETCGPRDGWIDVAAAAALEFDTELQGGEIEGCVAWGVQAVQLGNTSPPQ